MMITLILLGNSLGKSLRSFLFFSASTSTTKKTTLPGMHFGKTTLLLPKMHFGLRQSFLAIVFVLMIETRHGT
jgi:hypothetical protein